MSNSNDDIPAGDHPPAISFVKWLLLSLLLVTMLAFVAAHVHGRAGIVCRFAPLFGLVVGASIGWLAGQEKAEKSRRRIVVAAALGAAGFIGMTVESYRLYVAVIPEKIAVEIGLMPFPQEMIDNMVTERSRFNVYLPYRISENRLFGNRAGSAPWPAVIWAIEIFLAALLAAGTFHIFTRPPTQSSSSKL